MSEQPHPDGVRLLPWRIPPWTIDASLILLVVVGFLGRPFGSERGSFDTSEWIDLAIAIVLLVARRPFPLPAFSAGLVATVALVAAVDRPTLLMPATLVLLFTVATRFDRRTALLAGGATTAVYASLVIALLERGDVAGAGLASIAWPAFAVTAGVVISTTRENIAAADERARRAEATRELEARRQVIEERLRIARDVHDLVAHHIAVINVQSGVAEHLLDTDRAAASESLQVVRGAAATVVDELAELLSVLRAPDDSSEPTSPTPDLEAIEELIETFAASGLAIEHETSGARRPLSPSAQVAAYRVVQEALTNAHKHGDGAASIALRYDDTGLEISVTNTGRDGAGLADGDIAGVDGGGFGLIGMRERVEAVGGQLRVERAADRRFTVVATIPARVAT